MAKRQARGDNLSVEGLGERLRALREAYGKQYGATQLTKARCAARLSVSPSMYGRWESGTHLPTFDGILRICRLFRVDPNYLITGELSEYLEPWLYRALIASPTSRCVTQLGA